MACRSRCLIPIINSVSLAARNFGNSKKLVEIFEPVLRRHSSSFRWNLEGLRGKYVSNYCFSGSRVFGSSLVASVLYASIGCPHLSHAMDGQDVLVDSEEEADAFMKEEQGELRMLLKKIWPPIIFLYTIFVGWDDPVMLAARVVIFLLGSRPSPSSIYLFVEQLRHQLTRQEPLFCRSRSLYPRKVEVQDYKLLCVARVEVGSQMLNALGILGGWWVLPSSWIFTDKYYWRLLF